MVDIDKHIFQFTTTSEWQPGEGGCWTECPFAASIPLGCRCRFRISEELTCPFLDFKYKYERK
jgi:hypothetical protein